MTSQPKDPSSALGNCLDCGGVVSKRAAACPHCGNQSPFTVIAREEPARLTAAAIASDPLQCAMCGSRDIKTLKMAYEMGKSSSFSSTTGLGISTGGIAGGMATTESDSSTLLAQRIAPPLDPASDKIMLTIAASAAAIGSIVGVMIKGLRGGVACGILGFMIGIFASLAVHNPLKPAPANSKVYRRWARSRICLSCGNIEAGQLKSRASALNKHSA